MRFAFHLSLRDKFLLSFLGLAVVLTGVLTMLASRVSDILPEISKSQAQRYEAKLVVRDLRESILSSQVPDSLSDLRENEKRMIDTLKSYQDHLSINVSPAVYQALVTEDKGDLVKAEEGYLANVRKSLKQFSYNAQIDNLTGATIALTEIIDTSRKLEQLNTQVIDVLDQAEKTSQRFLLTFFLIALAILLLGITIFAQLLAVWITQPLRKIEEAARRIASGDFSQELKPDSHDELGMLMGSFDNMRKKVLQSLEEVRAFARRDELLIDSIVDVIIAVDQDRKIILYNAAAETATGNSRIGSLNRKLDDVLYFEDKANQFKHADVINEVIATGEARSFPKPVTLKGARSDKETQVTMTVAPFAESADRTGAVLVLRDVSATIELDELREEFVSIASHQLRTPLTAIRWLLEALIKGENEQKFTLNEKFHNLLEQSYARTLSMSELVSSLLALSRVDAQKLEITPAPLSLGKLFAKLESNFQAEAAKKNMRLSFVSAVEEDIVTDEVILTEILNNLITNAIKYSPENTSVEIQAARMEENVQIRVIDHGIGIPKEQQATVFKKFFRAKNALTYTPDGTGIGLYMVKAFANLIGADISFASEEGSGTTFTLCLPLSYSNE